MCRACDCRHTHGTWVAASGAGVRRAAGSQVLHDESNMASQPPASLYLDNYIDVLRTLPSEFKRNLLLLKRLDELSDRSLLIFFVI